MLGLKDGNMVFSEDKTRQGASRRWQGYVKVPQVKQTKQE
jgi:hypothetical protein